MTKVYHTSKSDQWTTPQILFDILNKEYNFVVDMAATKENKKCERYFKDFHEDIKTWDISQGYGWCNPPYSKIKEFLKGIVEHKAKAVVLIPSRTDTKWWHEFVPQADSVRFIKGRLKFGDSKHSAPFPSALIDFYNYDDFNTRMELWDWRVEV